MPATDRFPRTILGTCCVPWNEDWTIAEEIFRDSIRGQIGHGFTDLYIFGTAGEGYAVTERQFDEISAIFVEEMRQAGADPMVGVISLSLPTIIERIERAAALGVEAFQISLPAWAALSDKELAVFFEETCGRFPRYRFLHYNLPRTKRLVTPDEYGALAAKHPNLVATKNSGADYGTVIGLLEKAAPIRHFFTELGYGYGSLIGDCGFLISSASINSNRARAYFEAGVQRDAVTLAAYGRELVAIGEELKRTIGATAHIDGAYDKVFCKIHDPRFPLRLLPPYAGASDEAFDRFLGVLRDRLPHWLDVDS
ncbi:MAG: dihydrodipicolinate synthase family protein [Thermomicrobiales bacterium]